MGLFCPFDAKKVIRTSFFVTMREKLSAEAHLGIDKEAHLLACEIAGVILHQHLGAVAVRIDGIAATVPMSMVCTFDC